MKRSRMLFDGLTLLMALHVATCFGQQRDGAAASVPPESAVLQDKRWAFEATPAWRDEFDYTGLPDAAKWGHDLGGKG